MTDPWISVVVPVYDEERVIADGIGSMRDWLGARGESFELIVVDNASTDATVQRLEPLLDEPRVRLLRNDRNRGKGHSVRRGMLDATAPLRLMCDVDCFPSFRSLPRMLELIEGCDLVTGSRLATGARIVMPQPLARRIVGRTFVELSRRVLDEPTHDVYCGFKLWRGHAAQAVYSRTHLDDWVLDAELLAMARALGFRLCETGIDWSNREDSRLSMPRVLIPAVRDLAAARRHVRRELRHGPGSRGLVAEPADPGP